MLGQLVRIPAGFLGLPSLHSIIQAIAGGFFGALAGALVPSWLKHGTIATIQQLVALPDPASWTHVGALQSEMTFLGAILAPVTLTVGVLRYWAMGLTGAGHPVSAVTRCAGATAALVTYRWGIEEVVAGTNTLTHGVLGLPSVSGGLERIIGVLFGGALLSGAGGVFGAFLVIVGVVFAAGLFAAQVLLTVVLALLIVVGPPVIALAAIPELSHLARIWRDALLAVALIPLGWTVLFATAGALCLDATSFTGGAGGLPGHVAAAFAGLITFLLAMRLPFVLLGSLRGHLSHGSAGGRSPSVAASAPSAERVKSARARLAAVGLEAVPALGASVGRAAGALGAPDGGPIGAARRSLRAIRTESSGGATRDARTGADASAPKPGARERVKQAGAILRSAPREAMRSARSHGRPSAYPAGDAQRNRHPPGAGGSRSAQPGANRTAPPPRTPKPAASAGTPPARPPGATPNAANTDGPTHTPPRSPAPAAAPATAQSSGPPHHPEMHVVRESEAPPAAGAQRARTVAPGGDRDARSSSRPARPGSPPGGKQRETRPTNPRGRRPKKPRA